MADGVHLLTTEMGVRHTWIDNGDGTYTIKSEQDALSDILDMNKAMATHNDGYSPSRELRRVARIPAVLQLKWLQEEGWDAYKPENWNRLKAKLNSSEYLYLRTAPGRL